MRQLHCYWCEKPKTSREHVPPKCLFPEPQDTLDGRNHRDQLVTVPSCDEHNTAKSHDDEYFLCVLAFSILNNNVGHTQATTKVLRALEAAPGLEQLVLGKTTELAVQEIGTGTIQPTIAFKVEERRVVSVLTHIARGIHFHHYRSKWPGQVRVWSEFLVVLNSSSAHERNAKLQSARESANALFSEAEKFGSNQEIFYYQIVEPPEYPGHRIMRFSFYEGTRALALFEPPNE